MRTYTADEFASVLRTVSTPLPVQWTVKPSARRKTFTAVVGPGGIVEFRVPATMRPGQFAVLVSKHRGAIIRAAEDKAATGVHVSRKDLVSGEGFRLFGLNYRLHLVDDGEPISAGPGPSTWSGIRTWRLTARRDQVSARLIIEWYRAELAAWLDKVIPPLAARHGIADGLTWEVRPHREGNTRSWATYHQATHRIFVHWQVAQFPRELAEHVVKHELAHASRPGGTSHGREWKRAMDRIAGVGWTDRERAVKTLDGLTLWEGDVNERPAEPAPAPKSKMRGAGPVVCCGGHRDRCLIGHDHIWETWYENGRLVRTPDTFRCHRCGGVCTADEPSPADPAPAAFVSSWGGAL